MTEAKPWGHEGEMARAWRESHGLSRRRLSELTGYSERTIHRIELGTWERGNEVDDRTMKAYRLACASVALGVAFAWGSVTMEPMRGSFTVPLGETRKYARAGHPVLEEAEDDPYGPLGPGNN